MIRKWFSTFIVLFFVANLFSQTSEDKKYSLVSATENASISFLDILDPYLSPFTYSGLGVSYEHAEHKFFNPENAKFSMQGKWNALLGLGFNPANTAAMTYMDGAYSWGAFYHYRPLKNWQILAGATTDAQLGVKSLSRNVNNPVNVDLAVNLNLAGKARYDFNIFRQPVRLNYEIETSILGCMFVPLAGASYYEMFELWNLNNAIHFSSLHNKLGLKSALSLDVFLRRSTIQVGFASHSLLYEANNMVFKQNLLAFNIGYKYDFYIFKGRKNPAPANFMNSEK